MKVKKFHSLQRGRNAIVAFALFSCMTGWAQQVIDLAPSRAPTETGIAHLLKDNKSEQTLRILNMSVDSEEKPHMNLSLQRAPSITVQTQFVVIDGQGERPLQGDIGTRYTGHVEGDPQAAAFVSIAADGSMRSIIHQDGETIVNEYRPSSAATVSSTISRAVYIGHDFAVRPFQCGIGNLEMPADLRQQASHRPETTYPSMSMPVAFASANQRQADLIIDTDFDFFKKLGSNEVAAATYVADLMTHTKKLINLCHKTTIWMSKKSHNHFGCLL